MSTLPFSLPGCEISDACEVDGVLIIEAHTLVAQAPCPDCACVSTARHSAYQRHPADLSCLGQPVRLHLTVQRFRCDNDACPRRTFAETVPELLTPRARHTDRLTRTLRQIAFIVGGEAGARLSSLLGIRASSSTLLRLIRSTLLTDPAPAVVVGIDDWAKRKGHSYGTIVVDLEAQVPIDLLPDREIDTVTDWFGARPEVEIVTRDRGQNYRIGVTNGAPQAQQIADRWHLLKNLSEALTRQLNGHVAELRQAAHDLAASDQPEYTQADPLACHHPRQALADEVRKRAASGESQRQIAHNMQIARGTVARYLQFRGPLPRRRSSSQRSSVAPYLDILRRRWYDDGCQNISHLWQELRQQGFQGSYMSVYRAVRQFVKPSARPVEPIRVRTAAYLMTQPADNLDVQQQRILEAICEAHPVLKQVHRLAQRFVQMIRDRCNEGYDTWLADVAGSDARYLKTFAEELQNDDAAVRAALISPWSNGQTEGQVNRLKMLKRQMYGRANFDLLRLRVLYQPSAFT